MIRSFTLTNRNDQSPGRITIAVLISILLHLLAIGMVILLLGLRWLHSGATEALTEPIELTFVSPTYISTTQDQAAETPPDQSQFESDKNTRAASDAPIIAANDLPSQEGEKEDFFNFDNQDFSLGPQPKDSTPSPAASRPFRAQPQVQPKEQATTEEADSDNPRKMQDLALMRANPAQQQEAQPEAQSAPPPQPKTFQPERRVTRIQGGIANRGRRAANATNTPLGRYKKMLSDAIGSRWYYYVNNEMALMNIGTTIIRFRVNPDGKVNGVKVISNTSNENLVACSIRSIVEAEINQMPPEVVGILDGGQLEVDYTFTILGN